MKSFKRLMNSVKAPVVEVVPVPPKKLVKPVFLRTVQVAIPAHHPHVEFEEPVPSFDDVNVDEINAEVESELS